MLSRSGSHETTFGEPLGVPDIKPTHYLKTNPVELVYTQESQKMNGGVPHMGKG